MTLRLLVADESVTMQKMVRLAYAAEDAEIEAVFSGDAALDILYEFRPDVILAAVSLPGYSGYEVCELIRQDPEFATTPVILLTGAFDPFDDEEAARVEASGHLSKPFDTSEMIEMIEGLRPASAPDQHDEPEGQWGDFEEKPELANAEGEAAVETADVPADADDAATPSTAPPAIPPALPEWSFRVSPRSWESFLGAERILDIFGEISDKREGTCPIPEEVLDRVADKVVERMSPQVETIVRKILS